MDTLIHASQIALGALIFAFGLAIVRRHRGDDD